MCVEGCRCVGWRLLCGCRCVECRCVECWVVSVVVVKVLGLVYTVLLRLGGHETDVWGTDWGVHCIVV